MTSRSSWTFRRRCRRCCSDCCGDRPGHSPLPGRGLRSGTAGGPGAPLRSLLGTLYFALLGAGFMLLEVPFIQQFILFLGHPVLSLTLVLFALLLGTAAGSRRSQRWAVSALPARVSPRPLESCILVLLYRAVLPGVFALLLGQPVVVRGAATVALLLPLGMLLGMPFPSGIRWFERDGLGPGAVAMGDQRLRFGAGPVLAMVLAWKSGFSAALLAGMGSYALVALLAGMAHLTRKAMKPGVCGGSPQPAMTPDSGTRRGLPGMKWWRCAPHRVEWRSSARSRGSQRGGSSGAKRRVTRCQHRGQTWAIPSGALLAGCAFTSNSRVSRPRVLLPTSFSTCACGVPAWRRVHFPKGIAGQASYFSLDSGS